MATLKRRQYSLGDWMVGALRSLPNPIPDLTHLSNALSHVYCTQMDVSQCCIHTEAAVRRTVTEADFFCMKLKAERLLPLGACRPNAVNEQ